jgi:hypothetical protein
MLVLVFVRVCAWHGASLAVHPARIAIDVVFLFPDGHAMFDFIDDEAAGTKRFVAVRGAHSYPHGDVAQAQRAHAVHAGGARDAILRARFFDDTCAFLFGELGESLVFQARYRMAFIMVAHPAFEGRKAPAALVAHLPLQGGGIECARAEAKWTHPPATGGMNTTASPAFKGCDHSPNSALMATRSISGGSVNGYRARNSAYSSRASRAPVVRVSSLRPACSRNSA